MRLVLVRHGRTASNVARALDTAHPGAQLDEEGIKQAQRTAQTWDEDLYGIPQLIWASPRRRTIETAQPIADRFNVMTKTHPGLAEISAGSLEMATDRQSIGTYVECVFSWVAGDLQRAIPGGESGYEVCARFEKALVEAVDKSGNDATVVFVTHGALIRTMTALLAKNIDPNLVTCFPMENAASTVLEGNLQQGWEAKIWSGKDISELKIDHLKSGWSLLR